MTDITDESLEQRRQELKAYIDAQQAALAPWIEMLSVIEAETKRRLFAGIQAVTDHDLTLKHIAIGESAAALMEQQKAAITPFANAEELIENEMMRRLLERKAKNSKTDAGIFFTKLTKSTRVVDKVKFLDHVFEMRLQGTPNCYDMLTQAIAKDSVLAYAKEHAGEMPPGVTYNEFYKIQVRKG